MIQNIISEINTQVSNYSKISSSSFENTKTRSQDRSMSLPKAMLKAMALKIVLKSSLYGILHVIAYFNLSGFKGACFLKQGNYQIFLAKFGYKSIKERQVRKLCNQLVELGLVTRFRRNRRSTYEYTLTDLGREFWLLKNPSYRSHEGPRDSKPDTEKVPLEIPKKCRSQYDSSFNKSFSFSSRGKKMTNEHYEQNGLQPRTQESLDKDKQDEMRATERAKKQMEIEGYRDPLLIAENGAKADYNAVNDYYARLNSYTQYYRNQMRN